MERSLVDLVVNSERFHSDKGKQVDPSSISAFGIELSSRYGKAGELVAMLNFSIAAAAASVAHHVTGIDFDSKAGTCCFELRPSVVKGSEIELALFEIARETLGHFWWFDEEILDEGPTL